MGHAVVWFEVLGEDAAALRGFYGELFGWKFDLMGDYGVLAPPAGTKASPAASATRTASTR